MGEGLTEAVPRNGQALLKGIRVKLECVEDPLGLETRGLGVNGHPDISSQHPGATRESGQIGVNGRSGEDAHSGANRLLRSNASQQWEPAVGDSGSGLEDNDHGFDSEPEELAEEELSFGEPEAGPFLFEESEEEGSEAERDAGDVGGAIRGGRKAGRRAQGSRKGALGGERHEL